MATNEDKVSIYVIGGGGWGLELNSANEDDEEEDEVYLVGYISTPIPYAHIVISFLIFVIATMLCVGDNSNPYDGSVTWI